MWDDNLANGAGTVCSGDEPSAPVFMNGLFTSREELERKAKENNVSAVKKRGLCLPPGETSALAAAGICYVYAAQKY